MTGDARMVPEKGNEKGIREAERRRDVPKNAQWECPVGAEMRNK